MTGRKSCSVLDQPSAPSDLVTVAFVVVDLRFAVTPVGVHTLHGPGQAWLLLVRRESVLDVTYIFYKG